MPDEVSILRRQVARQVSHWIVATEGLGDLETVASAAAWASLEGYLGLTLRRSLQEAVAQLLREGAVLRAEFAAARSLDDLRTVQHAIIRFRERYMRTETLVDFYGQAVNSRRSPELGAMLRACDFMGRRSMEAVLWPLKLETPPVLTYLERGLGASILKAGLRLWDGGTLNPAAAVKITYHNRRRPTALIHETGHQVAHILGWNDELAATLERGLAGASPDLRRTWASWASEIAADAFAFVHCGFGAVSALSDVVAGSDAAVLRFLPGDPHPISYLRVLLGVEMSTRCFGVGPWDDLGRTWATTHDLAKAQIGVRELIQESVPLLSRVVELCLRTPQRAFGGRTLVEIVDPARVRPETLRGLERDTGAALYHSPYWLSDECLRLLALTTLQFAEAPERGVEILRRQEEWMLRLGNEVAAAA